MTQRAEGAATVDGADVSTSSSSRGSAANPLRAGVWRDFARLAAEGLTIGLLVSVLLAACVLMIAGSSKPPDREPATGPRASWSPVSATASEDRQGR